MSEKKAFVYTSIFAIVLIVVIEITTFIRLENGLLLGSYLTFVFSKMFVIDCIFKFYELLIKHD